MRLPEQLRRRLPARAPSPLARPEPASHVRPELLQRRDELAREVARLHFDLGGLTYEMAIRDHFRLDVLVRQAALLQERDAELSELERQVRLEDAGAAGACRSCGALHARGAAFCWQCGATLVEAAGSSVLRNGTNGHHKALATPPDRSTTTSHGGNDEDQ